MIRAVSFDVGGTLIRPHPSVGHIYAETAARHGCRQLSPALLNRRFAAAWNALDSFEHGYQEWAALVDQTFAGLVPEPPSRTFFPELYERFARPEAWAVFPDVVPALKTLAAAGLKLAVTSNWDGRLRPLLRKLRLDLSFRAIVVSCETACSKPHQGIFEVAAASLGLPPREILHVGDSAKMDVRGARNAGFQAVLLARHAPPRWPQRISSLQQLERLASGNIS